MKKKALALIFMLSQISITAQKVYINQAGYLPQLNKLVYASEPADSFFVIDRNTNEIKYRGPLSLIDSDDASTGLSVYRGDFSDFKTPGLYYIKTGANDTSYDFAIINSTYKDALYKSLKGFYFQRCGTALTEQYAGVYKRPAGHLNDAFLHSSTGSSGVIDETGGWHDAGDYGKYVVNAGISVGTLLMAYELFPERFSFDDLNIPESGNSVPDILDEVRYELEWLLKMQSDGGGVYFKVTRENFSGFIMPVNDNANRYIYQISSTATADFAAVAARASRVYAQFDSVFSNKCLYAAVKAWAFLKANPSIVPQGGFKNPSGTGTGEYGDITDNDERLWAASELFAATDDPEYNNYFVTNYGGGQIYNSMGWQNVRTMALLTYLTSSRTSSSTEARTKIQSSLMDYCYGLTADVNKSGFRTAISPGEFYWGSNSGVLNRAVILILGYDYLKDPDLLNAALDQLNYIYGCNGNDISFVTGVGEHHVMHPHHRPSAADGVTEPVPGLLAGGPDQGLDDDVLKAHYNASTPPAMCYIDDQGSYASNEIAINWNAPLVFVTGYFNYEGVITSVGKYNINIPNRIDIEQNYPNPFNSVTVINYRLDVSSKVRLKIFDALGKLLLDRDLGFKNAGLNHVDWNGTDNDGKTLSSGVYYFTLSGSGIFKKMVLLK